MRRIFFCGCCLLCLTFIYSQAESFVIASGDGIEFRKEDLSGKITLCFYETYKTMEVNQEAKERLAGYFSSQSAERIEAVRILGVTDCTEAKWPFVGMWKKGLVSVSEQIKQTIYGDWDGSMKAHYNLDVEYPQLIIFNNKGSIVYHNKSSVTPDDQEVIIQIFENLFKEQNL